MSPLLYILYLLKFDNSLINSSNLFLSTIIFDHFVFSFKDAKTPYNEVKKLISEFHNRNAYSSSSTKLFIDSIIAFSSIKDKESSSISKSGTEVKSPIIGTAYHAPEPGAKKFVEVGKKIKKGDTVMIVEAMKTMNHVPSSLDGTVKEILVEDGQPVEFGQVLIILE